ncbi:MAG: RDD family protein [Proteobacteria bacterium]|nr:RDD family protein [Pseudomonadota bacterium]
MRRRRVVAWLFGVTICCLLSWAAAIPATFLGLMSFGILWTPAWIAVALVPLAYNAFLVSGTRRSTWGQRIAGVRIETPDGRQAGFLQAATHFILFYLGLVFTCGIITVWTFFNPNKSLVHDILAGLEAHRAAPEGAA